MPAPRVSAGKSNFPTELFTQHANAATAPAKVAIKNTGAANGGSKDIAIKPDDIARKHFGIGHPGLAEFVRARSSSPASPAQSAARAAVRRKPLPTSTVVPELPLSTEVNDVKISIAEMAAATICVPEKDCKLKRLFDESPEFHAKLFGPEKVLLKAVHTHMAPDRKSRFTTQSFKNQYSDKVWVMAHNFRHREECDFYMSDVVEQQRKMAEVGTGFQYLVIKSLIYEDVGGIFANVDFKTGHELLPGMKEFDAFMNGTVNGESSRRILGIYGKEAAKMTVIRSTFADKSFMYSVVIEARPAPPRDSGSSLQ
ncbi:MAG: hypothetical protein V4754_21795 [Pseudomonadota bacterium]